MGWRSYGKTKNVTDVKNLRMWLNKYPEIDADRFIVTEKIDGSNFQIIFQKGKETSFGSRNNELHVGANFFDFQNAVLTKCADNIKKLQEYVDGSLYIDEINLYGELYGAGVQRRIQYSSEKHFLPFYMMVNGVPVSYADAREFMECANVDPFWWVPILELEITLDQALAIDVESLDTLVPHEMDGNRRIEGIVIEPLSNVYMIEHEEGISRFKLKKKSKNFSDKAGVKYKTQKQHKISPEGEDLFSKWSGMFNDNRLCDVESKVGPIEEMGQMGKYIKLLINDVREDFMNEYKSEFIGLIQSDRSIIMGSGGKLAAELLKSKLNKEVI
jgi:Rnl2 family RNA ligase